MYRTVSQCHKTTRGTKLTLKGNTMIDKMKKVVRLLRDEDYRFKFMAAKGLYNSISDEKYLKKMFKAWMGYELNLENPQTLNEKLQWLKLHDRKHLYTKIVDKYEVKKYVAEIIGEEYIVPTLGVWDRFEDINFELLPDQFVIKCTHDSGGLVICRDKSTFDKKTARRKIMRSLSTNYYRRFREWPYRDMKPRIIAEQYIEDESGFLTDYKFYCFNGIPDCVLTCFDRATGDTKYYFFDKKWELKRYNKRGKDAPDGFTVPKPEGIDQMFELAETLAKASEAPFIRVDLYNVYGKIYFGELTLYPAAGFDTGRLPETDVLFGNKVKLVSI